MPYLNGIAIRHSRRTNNLTIWGGLIVQDQNWPPLLNRLPDLALLLELDQEHPLGQRLRVDEAFNRCYEAWAQAGPATESRAMVRMSDEWGVLAIRTSSDILLRAVDQQGAFVG